MRPLIVDLGRDYRGGQHQALLLLKGLRERGHDAELIAVRDSPLASRAMEIGAPVHVADPKRRRLTAALQIRKLAREHGIDLVHANEPHALSSAWLAQVHRAGPVVVSRRIAHPLSRGHFSLARYRAAARIVAVSHFVEQSVIERGLSADRVSVIYDGVQIPPGISQAQRENARNQLGIAPEIPCIGNVAAFVPEKGHALLLDAFARLRAQFPECVLLLRGEGPELAKMQSPRGKASRGRRGKILASVHQSRNHVCSHGHLRIPLPRRTPWQRAARGDGARLARRGIRARRNSRSRGRRKERPASEGSQSRRVFIHSRTPRGAPR